MGTDKGFVNQATEQTIQGGGRGGGGGWGRDQFHYDGPGDNNLLSSKQSGPAKLLHSLKKALGQERKNSVRRQQTHL